MKEPKKAKKLKPQHEALLAEVCDRGLEVNGTTLRALQEAIAQDDERIDKEQKQQLEVEEREERLADIQKKKDEIWPKLLHRSFQEDPSKKSFLNLPRELRDMVYSHIFNHPNVTHDVMKIRYNPEWYRFYNAAW